MVVALGAVDSLTEKRSRRAARQFVVVDVSLIDGGRHEVDFGLAGPQAPLSNHRADNGVIRPVVVKLLTEPRPEAVSPKDDELSVVGSDEDSGQTTREVIGETTISEEPFRPAFDALRLRVGLEQPDLLKRRNCAVKYQRQTPQNRELIRRASRLQIVGSPFLSQQPIDLEHRRIDFGRNPTGNLGCFRRDVASRRSGDQRKDADDHEQWEHSLGHCARNHGFVRSAVASGRAPLSVRISH